MSIIAGLIGIIVGVGVTLWGVRVGADNQSLSTFLTSVGTSVITASVIGIMYEAIQKEVLTEDLFKTFGISKVLRDSGIQNIDDPNSALMKKCLKGGKIVVKPLDPHEWYSTHKSILFEALREQSVTIEIWIPALDDPAVATILVPQTHFTQVELAENLQRFMRDVEKDWNDSQIKPKSSLHIRSYLDTANIGFYVGSSISILEYRHAAPEAPTVISSKWMSVETGGSMDNWFKTEISLMEGSEGSALRLIKTA